MPDTFEYPRRKFIRKSWVHWWGQGFDYASDLRSQPEYQILRRLSIALRASSMTSKSGMSVLHLRIVVGAAPEFGSGRFRTAPPLAVTLQMAEPLPTVMGFHESRDLSDPAAHLRKIDLLMGDHERSNLFLEPPGAHQSEPKNVATHKLGTPRLFFQFPVSISEQSLVAVRPTELEPLGDRDDSRTQEKRLTATSFELPVAAVHPPIHDLEHRRENAEVRATADVVPQYVGFLPPALKRMLQRDNRRVPASVHEAPVLTRELAEPFLKCGVFVEIAHGAERFSRGVAPASARARAPAGRCAASSPLPRAPAGHARARLRARQRCRRAWPPQGSSGAGPALG